MVRKHGDVRFVVEMHPYKKCYFCSPTTILKRRLTICRLFKGEQDLAIESTPLLKIDNIAEISAFLFKFHSFCVSPAHGGTKDQILCIPTFLNRIFPKEIILLLSPSPRPPQKKTNFQTSISSILKSFIIPNFSNRV